MRCLPLYRLTPLAFASTIRFVQFFLTLLLALQLPASTTPTDRDSGDSLRAFLVTIGPGDAAWEKFGHNMIYIFDESGSVDVTFNWGMFDFEQKNFIWNFIRGRLWYWMEGFESGIIRAYKADDRTIWLQELNLSPEQCRALLSFCRRNELEDNRYYQYDYFRDNCSTRVRDAIDEAVAGQLRQHATTMPSDRTFRSETLRLTAGSQWLYTSLDFLLGHPTDTPISAWDEMFIPMRMRERLNEITILDASGEEVPLVKSQRLYHPGSRPAPLAAEPNRVAWFGLVGLLWGGAIAALSARLIRRSNDAKNPAPRFHAGARWGVLILAGGWIMLSALAGWLLVYIWTLTDHAAARPNENVLQLSPLLLPLLVLLPQALWGRAWSARWALAFAAAALAGSILGLLWKILPMMEQANGNLIALSLPAHAGLVWAMWRLDAALRAKGTVK